MKEIKWQKCPRCDSARTKEYNYSSAILIGLGIFITGIPLLIIIIGIFGMIFGAALTFKGFKNKGKMVCKDCKYTWNPNESKK